MREAPKKGLRLARETLRILESRALQSVAGGAEPTPNLHSVPVAYCLSLQQSCPPTECYPQ